MQEIKTLGEGIAMMTRIGSNYTKEETQKIANTIEKMLDTISGSAEREEAKQELAKSLIKGF